MEKKGSIIICGCGKICYSQEGFEDHIEDEECSCYLTEKIFLLYKYKEPFSDFKDYSEDPEFIKFLCNMHLTTLFWKN